MTDRGRAALSLSQDRITIGPSSMAWENGRLVIRIDELSTPHAQRITGRVVIDPKALTQVEMSLTKDGAHIWRPFAPRAEINVQLNRPGWQWRGEGYFDANFGTRALEADFSYWSWGRFPSGDGSACFYDAVRRDGSKLEAAIGFGPDGTPRAIPDVPQARLPRPPWMVRRLTRADAGATPQQILPMLDAPFYNRCAVTSQINGEVTTGVVEALDLDRFRGPWLMPMLAVRVPRRARWR